MTIWFTSDTHFGHENILIFEPKRLKLGATIKEVDEEIIQAINMRVRETDYLIMAGDIGLTSNPYLKECLDKIKCKHRILIRGNHDKHTDGFYRKLGFEWVFTELKLRVGGYYFRVSHYPYRKPWWACIFPWQYKEKDRHKRPIDNGEWLLHGHIHSGGRKEGGQKIKGKMINIGVDVNNYFPLSTDDILNIIRKETQ